MLGYSEPEWTSVVNHPDGRRFVTDGRLAMRHLRGAEGASSGDRRILV